MTFSFKAITAVSDRGSAKCSSGESNRPSVGIENSDSKRSRAGQSVATSTDIVIGSPVQSA